jgi:hypothetical protein
MLSWIRSKLRNNSFSHSSGQVVDPVVPGVPKYNGIAPKERHDQIEFAFTSGGIHYFRFSADVNIPFQRAVTARDILTEELWQINPALLQSWNEALIQLVINQKTPADKKLYEIGIMANRLKEQLSMSFSLTRTFKLASVMYFDEAENPLDYQYPYNQTKMKHWMEHNDIPGFFLNLPETEFNPSLREFSQNFPTFLEAETKRMLNTISHITTRISTGNLGADLSKSIISEMETLTALNAWSKNRFTNTTSSTQHGSTN